MSRISDIAMDFVRADAAPQPLKTVISAYVNDVLDHCQGNKSRAARVLGIDRRSLYRLLAKVKAQPCPRPECDYPEDHEGLCSPRLGTR